MNWDPVLLCKLTTLGQSWSKPNVKTATCFHFMNLYDELEQLQPLQNWRAPASCVGFVCYLDRADPSEWTDRMLAIIEIRHGLNAGVHDLPELCQEDLSHGQEGGPFACEAPHTLLFS